MSLEISNELFTSAQLVEEIVECFHYGCKNLAVDQTARHVEFGPQVYSYYVSKK